MAERNFHKGFMPKPAHKKYKSVSDQYKKQKEQNEQKTNLSKGISNQAQISNNSQQTPVDQNRVEEFIIYNGQKYSKVVSINEPKEIIRSGGTHHQITAKDTINTINTVNKKIKTESAAQTKGGINHDLWPDNGLCHDINNFGISCNIYSNLAANYALGKNLYIVSLWNCILNNMEAIESNAIILRYLLNSFSIFKKVYGYKPREKISPLAKNPRYAIEGNDSPETKEEKLRIITLDKLDYTNMILAHQASLIDKIYKYNNYQDIQISSCSVNYSSKRFIIELYLKKYYSWYREPVTDELCDDLFRIYGISASANHDVLNWNAENAEPMKEFIKDELK